MALSFCGKRLLLTRTNSLINQKRTGYIVLVPEIGEDLPDKNSLLREDGLLEFNNITIEKCVASIGKQALDIENNVKKLEETLVQKKGVGDVFREVLIPLEHYSAPLETTWGLAKTLYLGNSTLMPTKSYLSIHERARRARSAKFSNFEIYKAIKEANVSEATEEQKRLVQKYVLEGRLNGNDIEGHKKLELNEILGKMGKERATFQNKVNISTKQFKHTIESYNMVRDFPPSLLQATCVNPSQPTKGPWQITLQPYILNSFMEYCDDRTARWNVWQAHSRRSSGYNDKSLETSTHIENIRGYRNQQAKMLGYENYALMSMETKMAGDLNTVQETLNQLLDAARPSQEAEINLLQEFAGKIDVGAPLEMSDIPYWRRRYLKTVVNYDDEMLREYFPLPKVLSGLFELAERLYNIRIKERTMNVETWHEDVKYYDIFVDSDGHEPVSGFYLDLYTRDDAKMRVQENPGWMVGIRNRSTFTHTNPLSALIFNFQSPLYGKPSLLTFRDVKTLFNKFGYALQHLLTKTNYSEVAGVSNIEWDAVGISGHVFESFLNDAAVLKKISSHYVTEDQLTEPQLAAIHSQQTFLAGFNLSRELYLANLDLQMHIKKDFWLDIVKDLWPRYNVLTIDKKDSQPCWWTDVFSGEWGSAYYSHVWSKMVAADAYSAFNEAAAHSQTIEDVGRRFRDTFLSLGGACPPAEVFRRFRGRDPSTQALIAGLKLTKQKTVKQSTKEDTK